MSSDLRNIKRRLEKVEKRAGHDDPIIRIERHIVGPDGEVKKVLVRTNYPEGYRSTATPEQAEAAKAAFFRADD
jgi:hypothetical protein